MARTRVIAQFLDTATVGAEKRRVAPRDECQKADIPPQRTDDSYSAGSGAGSSSATSAASVGVR